MILTYNLLHQGKSDKGGWSVKQVNILGVPAITKGWLKRLIGKDYPEASITEFLSLKNNHLQNGYLRKEKKPIFKSELFKSDFFKSSSNLVAFFDGACGPKNPFGHIGYGFVILEDGVVLYEKSGYLAPSNTNSNNVAEYLALNELLAFLVFENLQNEPIKIFGDSMLVVKQMNLEWRILGGLYAEHALLAKQYLYENFTNWDISWIPRELNTLADEQSKKEFIRRGIIDISDKRKN